MLLFLPAPACGISLTTYHQNGQRHWLPADWVQDVGETVRLTRSLRDTRRDWLDTPPGESMGAWASPLLPTSVAAAGRERAFPSCPSPTEAEQ